MRWLAIATWTHLDVANKTVKSLSLWMNEFTVIAAGAIFEYLIRVLNWSYLL
jgi:hypothetical protein